MAPRPQTKVVSKTAKPIKSAAKPTKPTPVAAPAMPQQPATCGCTSSGCGGGLMACMCSMVKACPLGKQLVTRSFWAAAVVAFLVVFATDWLLHARLLVTEYQATSAFWRTGADVRHGLIFLTQALTALVYAAIILGMGHAFRWWGAAVCGLLAASPAALTSVALYATMPFAAATIPLAWAAGSLGQGVLAGLAICAVLRLSRAPQGQACGCGPSCGCGS